MAGQNSDITDALSNLLQGWLPALGILFLTLVSVRVVRWFLRRAGTTGRFKVLTELAPALSNLIYLIGLRMFIEAAPLNPKVLAWLDGGIYIIGVLIFLGLVRRAALIAVEWTARKTAPSATLQLGFLPVLRNVVTLFVFLMGGIMILKHFNYDVMSLLAALGVGSLAVGLAAKDTLSHMISGFTLIIDRNLMPGDRISLSGYTGDVDEIGLRSTRIRLGNGNMLIVPNTELVNTKILNLSQPTRAVSCSSSFKVSCETPFPRVKAAALATVSQLQAARADVPAWVHLSSLASGAQLITAGFWVADMSDEDAAVSEFNEKLLARLAQDGIRLSSTP